MSLQERVSSLETEYAVNFYPVSGSRSLHHDDLVRALRDVIIRDVGSPEHRFLTNGSKMDRDVGQIEWSLPECRSAHEVVVYDQAADSLLQEKISSVEEHLTSQGYVGQLKIFKNNVDFQGQTYGCHENYQTLRCTELLNDEQFLHYLIYCLTPFLVTRQILLGTGQIIPAVLATGQPSTFLLSQRAAFIQTTVAEETRRQRPIINLSREQEPLADQQYRRLHLILGDSNLSPWASWIKIGTMGILLRMIEDQFMSDVPALVDPVEALHAISRDATCTETVALRNGELLSAIDIQWYYCQTAREYLRQREATTEENAILIAWTDALNDLAQNPMLLADRADWAIKRQICELVLYQHGASWEQMPESLYQLRPYDLRYHDLSDEGHFNRLCQALPQLRYNQTAEAEVEQAKYQPPAYTRANLRGNAIMLARNKQANISVDGWCDIQVNGHHQHMGDPLDFDAAWLSDYQPFDAGRWRASILGAEIPVRVRAIRYLSWRCNDHTMALLMDIIRNDESPQVRRVAVENLGKYADPRMLDGFMERLSQETDPEVLWAIQAALTRIIKNRPMIHIDGGGEA